MTHMPAPKLSIYKQNEWKEAKTKNCGAQSCAEILAVSQCHKVKIPASFSSDHPEELCPKTKGKTEIERYLKGRLAQIKVIWSYHICLSPPPKKKKTTQSCFYQEPKTTKNFKSCITCKRTRELSADWHRSWVQHKDIFKKWREKKSWQDSL